MGRNSTQPKEESGLKEEEKLEEKQVKKGLKKKSSANTQFLRYSKLIR
jgi:hypothetical protein